MKLPAEECWGLRETPLGIVGLRMGPQGLLHSCLPADDPNRAIECLGGEAVENLPENADALKPWLEVLERAMEGKSVDFSPWKIDYRGIRPFTERVLEAAREIPAGQTRSYWWVAVRAGDPLAARAVGQVMAKNRFPLVIPCHRVVRRDGSLGGFGGGSELKRALLSLEGCDLSQTVD